jgi:hypothetical protein
MCSLEHYNTHPANNSPPSDDDDMVEAMAKEAIKAEG